MDEDYISGQCTEYRILLNTEDINSVTTQVKKTKRDLPSSHKNRQQTY